MFRFTIRDVLLVMVIVGLAVGWSGQPHLNQCFGKDLRTPSSGAILELAA